ncbi:MAG: hypothetical protein KF745_04450 [Phycisphaeraceae bacterium]|nr:hypothetical protein [Phycisphaeraceae bacterium]
MAKANDLRSKSGAGSLGSGGASKSPLTGLSSSSNPFAKPTTGSPPPKAAVKSQRGGGKGPVSSPAGKVTGVRPKV